MTIYEDDSKSTVIATVLQPDDFTAALTSSGPRMYIEWNSETFDPIKDYFRVGI